MIEMNLQKSRLKSKKAQIIGQVFVFILATVVFVLIIMYGYRAISSLMTRGEQAQLVQFQNELTSAVDEISFEYGSVKCKELTLPKKYTKFCFVDDRVSTAEDSPLAKASPLILGSIVTKTAQNVFLVPPSEVSINLEKAIYSQDPYFFCMNVTRNKIMLRLQGKGIEGVELSRWQDTKC